MGGLLGRWWRRGDAGPTAFVLGGGGNLGAIQVGMLRALVERSIVPDLVVGCSVGALNGAAFAQDPNLAGVERLDALWRSISGKDLMPTSWVPPALLAARKGQSIHGNDGLRQLIEGTLRARTFEELAIPFECVATDLDGASEVWFRSGPLVDPILASSAIPAVYPPVTIDGARYIDGAVVNDIPISRAVELGARRLYVLHVGSFDRPRPEPKRPLDIAVQAYWIARRHRFQRELRNLPPSVRAVVLPTGATPRIPFNDFTRSEAMIDGAYTASAALLATLAAAGHRV